MKLNAAQLRDSNPTAEDIKKITRKPVYIIVDNVLDTYNVGAIFRLADAIACSGVYLVGQTNEPIDERVGHKIHKASVGVWQWVPWKHVTTVQEAVERITDDIGSPLQVIAIEQDAKSIPYTEIEYNYPIAFIIGHETDGVSKEALKAADQIAEIPMFGVNKSLNVMISLAIVMWHVVSVKTS